jgi:hypothetical protein
MQRLTDVIFSPNLSEAARGIELAAKICGDMGPEVEINISSEQIRSLIQMLPDTIKTSESIGGIDAIDITPIRE